MIVVQFELPPLLTPIPVAIGIGVSKLYERWFELYHTIVLDTYFYKFTHKIKSF